jgi:hypothetical protein
VRVIAFGVVAGAALACNLLVSTTGLAGPADGDGGGADTNVGSDGSANGNARSDAYRAAVLADQPLAYWRLGEPKAAMFVSDTASAGGQGLVQAGTNLGVPGVFGEGGDTAADFDGNKAGIDFADVFDFTENAVYSLEAWVRPTVVDAQFRRVIDHQLSNTQGYRLLVRAPSSSTPGISCGRCVPAGECVDARSDAVDFREFVHVVCAYDGSSVTLYIDGALAKKVALPTPIASASSPFRIGHQNDPAEVFVGSIDEVAVYDKVLATERVSAHYRAARP